MMSPMELDRSGSVKAVRDITAIARTADNAAARSPVAATSQTPAATAGSSAQGRVGAAAQTPVRALDAGQPPVDPERVAELKRAIEKGDYPIVPAKIADALIAAGMLLQKGE